MGVSLSKGGNVSLEKVAPGLTKIVVGLGWDARGTDGAEFDLDASLFRDEGGKCFAMLWRDKGRSDIFLPLAGTKEVRVIRIDGRNATLQAGEKGIGLSVGPDPLLLTPLQ